MGRLQVLFLLLFSLVGAAEKDDAPLLDKQQAEIADLLREFELAEQLVEKQVSMQGELVFKSLPGGADSSSAEEEDAVVPCWLLRIEPSKEEIALCLSDDLRDFCDQHVGKRVSIEGALFPAHTAHHPTRVLIDVQKMEMH
ncbi:MAG TPA: DUF4431 domain-containing protein [Rhabdochlamydiaceae bacterium]|nr:DUF4431 domain-containing protein [Rhabdochlamydiaceae bacterium]